MPEHRVTVVIAEDPDAETVTIRGLGDHYLPAPIEKPARQFRSAWMEFGQRMETFLSRDEKDRGPWT
jgi:hypothetical protein